MIFIVNVLKLSCNRSEAANREASKIFIGQTKCPCKYTISHCVQDTYLEKHIFGVRF